MEDQQGEHRGFSSVSAASSHEEEESKVTIEHPDVGKRTPETLYFKQKQDLKGRIKIID